MSAIAELEKRAGVVLFDHQVSALNQAIGQPGRERLCLYYKTGAGKTLTSLTALAVWGWDEALVIAPPSTHEAWEGWGIRTGVKVQAMSHAKFRMKDTKVSRSIPVVADEVHMFGGHRGQGWVKLERLAQGLQAPLIVASATPNYNDAERCYCIQRLLDPLSCKGGFLQFIYTHCTTEVNPFAHTPNVTGFTYYPNAEHYLASLPGVAYLPDDLVYTVKDVPAKLEPLHPAFLTYGYDLRKHRMIASGMEERHTRTYQTMVTPRGRLWPALADQLMDVIGNERALVYCNHATIARAAYFTLLAEDYNCDLVTGETSKQMKNTIIDQFRQGNLDVLVGTATLATGTDGLDKVCDRLIILDDTDDDSLRRQLIGRIMPRGADTDASKKQVYRLLH